MKIRHYFTMQHILALITFVYSIAYVIGAIAGMKHLVLVSAIGTSILGLCALIVLLRRDPDPYFTAGIMGVGFGCHMIFSFVTSLSGESILIFIIGIIGILAGLLTIMFSVPLYCGNRYDTKRIMVVLGVYLAAYLLPMAIFVAFFNYNFYKLLEEFSLYMLFFIPVTIYIVMLYKTNVGYKGASSRSNSNIKMLTDALYSDQNTYAWRSDVKKIASKEYMTEVNKGHIKGEKTLPLIMGGKNAYLVIQEWDNGCIYGSIMRHEDGTLVQSLRFEITDVVADGEVDTSESFTIYGREGFFIRILIKDEEVERNNSRTRKILTWLVGANSKY